MLISGFEMLNQQKLNCFVFTARTMVGDSIPFYWLKKYQKPIVADSKLHNKKLIDTNTKSNANSETQVLKY